MEDSTLELAIIQSTGSPYVAVEIKNDVIHVHVKGNSASQNGSLVPSNGHSPPPVILEYAEPKVQRARGANGGVIDTSSSEFRIERWEDPIV